MPLPDGTPRSGERRGEAVGRSGRDARRELERYEHSR
jgi:hypothetical protein